MQTELIHHPSCTIVDKMCNNTTGEINHGNTNDRQAKLNTSSGLKSG